MADSKDDNRGPQLAAVIIVLLILCWVAVGLRCYTMTRILKRFHAEDWLAAVTLVAYSAYSVFCLLGVHFGLGAHVEHVLTADRPKALQWKWAAQVAYIIVSVMVKLIAGLLLLRLCDDKRWQRITLWVVLGITIAFNVCYLVLAILQCRPIQYYWFRYDEGSNVTGTCNGRALATIPTYISFVISVLSDWILALIPFSIVWNAKMDHRTKISVACVLGLGSIASIATIMRIPYAKQLLSNPDYLYNFTDLAIWSTVEIGLGLTATGLATLKPLFRQLRILAKTRNDSYLTANRQHSISMRSRPKTANPILSRIRSPRMQSYFSDGALGESTSDLHQLKHTWVSGNLTTTISAHPPSTPPSQPASIYSATSPSRETDRFLYDRFSQHIVRTKSFNCQRSYWDANV